MPPGTAPGVASKARARQVISDFSTAHDCDIVCFRDKIEHYTADDIAEVFRDRQDKKPNLALILTTYGGNPDAAYRIGRAIQNNYKGEKICYIFGLCKSAGTLISLAADEIVISDDGELGPLDIQLAKEDRLGAQRSGLDVQEALDTLTSDAFLMFKHLFHGAYGLGRGAISVKTASDIAATLTTGLMSPITSQIDPLSVGETARLLRIVQEYGWRLSPMDDKQAILEAIAKLSSDYPSHEFIIDRDEARRILPNVRAPRGDEVELDRLLRFIARVPPDPNTNAGAYVNYLNAPTSATPSPTAAPPSAASVPPPPATPPAAPSASTDGPLHHATEPNGHHQGE